MSQLFSPECVVALAGAKMLKHWHAASPRKSVCEFHSPPGKGLGSRTAREALRAPERNRRLGAGPGTRRDYLSVCNPVSAAWTLAEARDAELLAAPAAEFLPVAEPGALSGL